MMYTCYYYCVLVVVSVMSNWEKVKIIGEMLHVLLLFCGVLEE